MTCSEEYHQISEDGKEHINTLWTVETNTTNQIKEIMMYKLDSTSQDVTYLKSKYKYALDGFGNDQIEYVNDVDNYPSVKINILSNLKRLSENNIFGNLADLQYPYIYINRNYKPYATNFSGTLSPNARDIQLRELIKQKYHLFDKDLNMKEFRENEYKLTNIPYKKWVPDQKIQLQNIMFTDPPSFLGAINPFPWV